MMTSVWEASSRTPTAGDRLRVFLGWLPDGGTAAGWTVPSEVSVPTVWAALNCPGGGWQSSAPAGRTCWDRPPYGWSGCPTPGDRCVVRGALASAEGRKALVHSTLYGSDGIELARARATWIAIRG